MLEYLADLICFALHISDYGVFPKTLSREKEAQLLQRKAQGDTQAEKQLVRHNLRLVVHVIKKYYADESEQDDLISIGTIGLIKGVHTFNPEKGTRLATYAARCIENEVLMFYRNKGRGGSELSLNDPIETDAEGNPLTIGDILFTEDNTVEQIIYRQSVQRAKQLAEQLPPGREKQIITMRYGLDGNAPMTQAEVAKRLHISRSYVSRIETKILRRMREEFDKE